MTIQEKWIKTFPELATRPILLKELMRNHGLRRWLFRWCNEIHTLSTRLKGSSLSTKVIERYGFDVFTNYCIIFGPDEHSDQLVSELFGFANNLLKNCLDRANPNRDNPIGKKAGKYFVQREWRNDKTKNNHDPFDDIA